MSSEGRLIFAAGTLLLQVVELPEPLVEWFKHDPRSRGFRALASDYREIALAIRANSLPIVDEATAFAPVDIAFKGSFTPRPHQSQAYSLWRGNQWRGITAIPTGGGKSLLGCMAMAKLQRPTLILVPTLDLLEQWCSLLRRMFGIEPGVLGGGERRVEAITVSTYDSAVIHMEFIGDRFALLICDECHHLPGPAYRAAAMQCVAPYRLGLSATPDQGADPERSGVLTALIGPVVAEVAVAELEGGVLAPYVVRSVELNLPSGERAEYEAAREEYRTFVRRWRINFSSPDGWRDFLMAVARRPGGRDAFNAYLRQRAIARQSEAKTAAVWEILQEHRGERVIIFTADNSTAYRIGRNFRLPVITHDTKLAERRGMLDGFRSGIYPVMVTSKVLNEGVDVPEAAVGIIVSGSGSVREHVQRLGRILRARPGKQAVLYELIAADTAEKYTMIRRRRHSAYRNKTGGGR